jgi:hypothetical protein
LCGRWKGDAPTSNITDAKTYPSMSPWCCVPLLGAFVAILVCGGGVFLLYKHTYMFSNTMF